MGREKKFSEQQLWQVTHDLILEKGYQGFTMSLVASRLDVSRAAIYKQYPNKEELIGAFMLYEMQRSVALLQGVDRSLSFESQLCDLLTRMFSIKDLHHILGIASTIEDVSPVVTEQKAQLSTMHHGLYEPLLSLIQLGKKEQLIDESQNDFILLGFIFQSIDIPNYAKLSDEDFLNSVQNLLLNGLSKK